MEIIRKKICIEDFISRIPSLKLDCIDKDENETSWGKIANNFYFRGKYFRYKYIMDLYYDVLNLIMDSIFLIRENYTSNSQWFNETLTTEKNWRDYFHEYINNPVIMESDPTNATGVNFINSPKTIDNAIEKTFDFIKKGNNIYYWNEEQSGYTENTGVLLCISNYNNLSELKTKIKTIIGSSNLFDFIKKVHDAIGKYVVPTSINNKVIEGIYVPIFIYDSDLDETNTNSLIYIIKKLKNNKSNNKLINKKYKEYGGDLFLDYLEGLKNEIIKTNNSTNENNINTNENGINPKIPTLDIPILITSEMLDLGQYKAYDVDVINDENTKKNENISENYSNVVIQTKGESKIRSLINRKATFIGRNVLYKSINGNSYQELVDSEQPFQKLKVKNIQQVIKKDNHYEVIGDSIININYNDNEGIVTYEYVIGGKFKINNNKYECIGNNPFDNKNTDIYGIWYKETFPLSSNESGICVDLTSCEITYTFDDIDYDRKNFIMCNDIKYTQNNATYTNDPIFYDEKMLGLALPLKENYNVAIDRGSTRAFERHLQLTEIKTWQDMENYRNGLLLNKEKQNIY